MNMGVRPQRRNSLNAEDAKPAENGGQQVNGNARSATYSAFLAPSALREFRRGRRRV
jgi:hypothetical protein